MPTPNPIQVENAKAGSSSWQLTNPATNHEIEGYASATSVNAGGQIDFYVNTTSSFFTIDVYRIGWYAGLGGRELAGPVTVAGAAQPTPTPDPTTGLVECNWTKSYTLTTGSTWTSGYYLAKLTATSSGKQSYIIFVVRNDSSTSAHLMQSCVTTYQAYNNWGGKSLYSFNSTNSIPAVKVSFDRPYAMGSQSGAAAGVGAGDFIANFAPSYETYPAGWEINMLRFLEREGYDVSYCTSIDVAVNGATLLPKHDGFLSVGHDEYWSWNQRSNVEAARDAGVSLGFFGADPCYWQIRFEANSSGTANRREISYKENADTQDPYALDPDPTNDYLITGLWRENSADPPEDAFIGVMYVTDPVNGNLTIEDSSNWVCANTGLTDGVSLSGLLGYEMDCMFFDAPEGTARVGHSSYTSIPMPTRHPIEGPLGGLPDTGSTVYSDMTVYTADSGATVFATGSMQWNFGLDDYNYPGLRPSFTNAAAQQITRNVLASFVGARPSVSPPPVTVTFSDNFNDNVMDPNKWQLGAIAPTLTGGPGAWDTKVTVAEQNQQMQVSPITRTGNHYNGYVSVPSIDLTNASAAVQVVDVANGNADTYLAVDIDSQNNYKIQQEGGLLSFAEVIAGVVNQVSIPYDPVAHQFWRIRHIQSTDSIVFETSRDGDTWTLRNSLPRDLTVNAMKMEIGAGTGQSVTGAGTASFDNFEVDARPSPPPTPTPTATPIPTPTPSPTPTPTPETVSTPTKPTGTTSTYTNHSYTYTTGGSVDNYGYSVQYYFDWGDGTNSGWLPVGTVSATKTWTTAASRSVKAQARSSVHTTIVSAYSAVLTVTVTAESVTAPTKPSGPTSGTTNTSYTYSTSGSVDNAGDSVQYLFDWADGTTSGWLAVGTKLASHKWTTSGTKTVKAQARCSIHTSVVSAYSTGLSVTINPPETISTPTKPSGPTTGKSTGTYTFSTSGSVSSLGHSVQYQFDWGDGGKSAWLAVGTKSASHTWGDSGTFTVKAQARCSIDTSVLSANSTGATITLSP